MNAYLHQRRCRHLTAVLLGTEHKGTTPVALSRKVNVELVLTGSEQVTLPAGLPAGWRDCRAWTCLCDTMLSIITRWVKTLSSDRLTGSRRFALCKTKGVPAVMMTRSTQNDEQVSIPQCRTLAVACIDTDLLWQPMQTPAVLPYTVQVWASPSGGRAALGGRERATPLGAATATPAAVDHLAQTCPP
jgi:hypothetical protein